MNYFLRKYLLAITLLAGCDMTRHLDVTEEYGVEVISNLSQIMPTEPLRIIITGTEELGLPSIVASAEPSQSIEIVAERGFSSDEWILRPATSWPVGVVIKIQLFNRDRLMTEFEFEVAERTWIGSPKVSLLAPISSSEVPPNTRFLIIDSLPVDRDLKNLRLFSSGHEMVFNVVETLRPGRFAAKLHSGSGFCDGLCPATEYDVWAEYDDDVVATELVLRTATITDSIAPVLQLEDVGIWSHELRLRFEASESVLGQGRIRSELGEYVELQTAEYYLGEIVLSNIEVLKPDTSYQGEIEFWDLSGNKYVYQTGLFRTPESLDVEITEIVPTPFRDWNDSEPNGEPFDSFPGKGTVSSADEWIELVNKSSVPIDIRKSNLFVRVIDSRPTETSVRSAPGAYLADKQEEAIWLPNTALVLRLRGEMTQTDFIVQVFQGSQLLDEVVIGRDVDSVHAGGRSPRPEFESIAKDEFGDWRWCLPSPGRVSLRGNCL